MRQTLLHRVKYAQTRYVSFDSVTRNRVHQHSFYEPCIVISGSGEFEHEAETFALDRGDLFIADRGADHEIRSLSTRDLKLYFLRFHILKLSDRSPGDSQPLLDANGITNFMLDHRNHLSGQAHLIPLFEHVARLVRRDAGFSSDRNYHDATMLLLRQVIGALTMSAGLSPSAYADFRHRRKIEDYIDDHLHLTLRVTDIAVQIGMSERTLRRRWSGWSGRTLPEEINHRRMERATHLLLLPDISVSDVGYQVGIASAAQFSRMFKAAKGCAPGEFRRRHRDEIQRGFSINGNSETVYRDGQET